MAHHIEMFRDAAEPHGRDRFSCSVAAWDLMRELGTVFGWQPLGTTYVTRIGSKIVAQRRDYGPGDARDEKSLEAADAFAWANALERAKASPHFPAMLDATVLAPRGKGNAASLANLIDEFIAWLYGGAFTFALPP